MKVKKIIQIIVAIVVIFLLLAGSYMGYMEYQRNHTPDELQLKEKEEIEEAYGILLEESLALREQYDWIVVINPAHGGSESGLSTAYGVEKDITLAVAEKVSSHNTNPKVGIFLTRTTDTNPDENKRNEFIQKMQADMFIDLHVNKDTQASIFGTKVYYTTEYYDNRVTNGAFADIMERSIVTAIEGQANGIAVDEQKEYTMLQDKTIPSVCVEMGYISNSTEGVLLTRENYQNNLAKGIAAGIEQTIEQIEEQQ